MRCRLCGFQFEPEGLACHTQCPMGQRCSLICCPNCGFQVVDESKSRIARGLRRLWPASEEDAVLHAGRKAGTCVPLTHVGAGTPVEVERLEGMPATRLTRLTAFGLAPGSAVTILQRRPVPVVSVGDTELALSEEILAQILVRPPG